MERLLATVDQTTPPGDVPAQVYLRATATGELLVKSADPAAADRELAVQLYACKQAWAGAEVGNVIRNTETKDVSAAVTTTVSTQWQNLSTGAEIAAPPNIPDYTVALTQGDGLTFAQLQAAGLATATNQNVQTGYLADAAEALANIAGRLVYNLVQSEDLGAGTKYIMKMWTNPKTGATGWQVIRKAYTDTSSTMGYASQANNSATTTPTAAWTSRASLQYGDLSAA